MTFFRCSSPYAPRIGGPPRARRQDRWARRARSAPCTSGPRDPCQLGAPSQAARGLLLTRVIAARGDPTCGRCPPFTSTSSSPRSTGRPLPAARAGVPNGLVEAARREPPRVLQAPRGPDVDAGLPPRALGVPARLEVAGAPGDELDADAVQRSNSRLSRSVAAPARRRDDQTTTPSFLPYHDDLIHVLASAGLPGASVLGASRVAMIGAPIPQDNGQAEPGQHHEDQSVPSRGPSSSRSVVRAAGELASRPHADRVHGGVVARTSVPLQSSAAAGPAARTCAVPSLMTYSNCLARIDSGHDDTPPVSRRLAPAGCTRHRRSERRGPHRPRPARSCIRAKAGTTRSIDALERGRRRRAVRRARDPCGDV